MSNGEDPMLCPPLDWADYLDGDAPGNWDDLSPEERDELETLFEDDDPSAEADQ
jgi:hypothetical protein